MKKNTKAEIQKSIMAQINMIMKSDINGQNMIENNMLVSTKIVLENTSDEIIKLEANLTELYSRQRTYNIVIETIEIWLSKQRRSK